MDDMSSFGLNDTDGPVIAPPYNICASSSYMRGSYIESRFTGYMKDIRDKRFNLIFPGCSGTARVYHDVIDSVSHFFQLFRRVVG